jgi:hypothetical protein
MFVWKIRRSPWIWNDFGSTGEIRRISKAIEAKCARRRKHGCANPAQDSMKERRLIRSHYISYPPDIGDQGLVSDNVTRR